MLGWIGAVGCLIVFAGMAQSFRLSRRLRLIRESKPSLTFDGKRVCFSVVTDDESLARAVANAVSKPTITTAFDGVRYRDSVHVIQVAKNLFEVEVTYAKRVEKPEKFVIEIGS